MDPPIGQSVTYTHPDRWDLGNLFYCEKITGPTPTDAIATWKDGDSVLALRTQPENHVAIPGDTVTTRTEDCGTCLARWDIGPNVICRVESWLEGMELESNTVRFVREKMPSVPVPELIHNWVDRAWNRTFLLMKRPLGQTLDEAWPGLTHDQARKLAADLAEHTVTLSQFTSPRVETITGCGIADEMFLLTDSRADIATRPSWMPTISPVFTPETLTAHIRARSGEDPPEVGKEFHFYNFALCPTLIYVSVSGPERHDAQVTAISDWQSAGYLPHWWMALRPRACPGFKLGTGLKFDDQAWPYLLSYAIQAEGFDFPIEFYARWREYERKQHGEEEDPWVPE